MSDSPKPPPSFLAQGIQGDLIPLEDLPDSFYEGEESGLNASAPRYTASRFFVKRPQDYQLCVAFLAAGTGLLKIARILKVHHMTVAAVRDIEGAEIDIQKERIKRNIRTAIDVAAERLPDIMAKLSDAAVPISTAVLIDKLAQLEGEPTSRVEVTIKGHLTHEALIASLDQFPEAIEVEVTEVSPMVLRGETSQQKGTSAPAPEAPNPAPGEPAK